MIDEFHVMYMYKKIQVEAATTDIKTLEQLLKKFRSVVNERREEYYQEIGEKKAHKLKMKTFLPDEDKPSIADTPST
ncbi:TPA: DNA-binding protein [Escherichia coli]|nr:DNA-binding protein [Escherichia coli]